MLTGEVDDTMVDEGVAMSLPTAILAWGEDHAWPIYHPCLGGLCSTSPPSLFPSFLANLCLRNGSCRALCVSNLFVHESLPR